PELMTPYERDASCEKQSGQPRAEMLQAYIDINSGLLDTDLHGYRGVEQASESPSAVTARKDRDDGAREVLQQTAEVEQPAATAVTSIPTESSKN
ncbi:MAG: hypothetical protein ABI351_00295, partial [Herbaspirillum sp.]